MARTALPAGSCDAHMHIFDARFPGQSPVPSGATAADYRQVQARLGTTRTVVVQPRPHGTDNGVTLDAIAQLGLENARGIAVVRPDVSDDALQALHAGGIRGVRFTLYTPRQAPLTFDMVEPVAQRVRDLGWHLQLHWTADQIVAHEALLRRLRVPLVFDHLARLPLPAGTRHPAFAIVRDLLAQQRAWVKLSGAYLDSRLGAAASYTDVLAVARAWVECAPDRLVWGSDWPHTTESAHPPDDAQLLALLTEWTGTEDIRRRVLVDNPTVLYGFHTS